MLNHQRKMRKVQINDLEAGMMTAIPIFTKTGVFLIERDTVLTKKIITMLHDYSVYDIAVWEDLAVEEKLELKKFEHDFYENVVDFKQQMNAIVEKNMPIDVNSLLKGVKGVLANSRTGIHMMSMLGQMQEHDDATYIHGMNVALICNMMGRWLRFAQEDIDTLTIAGLLHDIGKLTVPEEILKKPGKLTDAEYEIMRHHPIQGYDILKEHNLDERILFACLMHHERCDGSGYPYGLMDSDIPIFAKIIAIADVYDAMTSARVYREPISPLIVAGMLQKDGLQLYDTQFIMTFLERIIDTFINTQVLLSDGNEGEIIFINRDHIEKPIIYVGNGFVDLAQDSSVEIVKFI